MSTVSIQLEAMVPAGATGLGSPKMHYCTSDNGEFGMNIPIVLKLNVDSDIVRNVVLLI